MAAKKLGKVAIIYSDEQRQSSESRNLAHYLCGLLSTSGYAQIVMIPFSSEGPIADLSSRRISYIPPKQSKPIEVPVSSFSPLFLNVSRHPFTRELTLVLLTSMLSQNVIW